MPRFELNDCSVTFRLTPLSGALAAADRQVAWRAYLALVTWPRLRDQPLPSQLIDLIDTLRTILSDWPAGSIDTPTDDHLGFGLVAVIEIILLPCLDPGGGTNAGCSAARTFCQNLAREIAQVYAFPDPGARVPADVLSAWSRGA